jgi:dTDP-4-amino-4,6-dideoxygalactose transaminase
MINNKILFNIPLNTGKEIAYIEEAVLTGKLCGDGTFTKKCNQHIKDKTEAKKVLLTTSCTHALEMAAILLDIKEGDEVIMPSYTFVSTANAFALRGAKIIFIDVERHTMNIDANLIEAAITAKTKVIVPVHYGGVGCDMDMIMDIAKRHNLFVVEDAAQCVGATYKGKALGTIGDFGTYSFHETKNIHCGEGGALLINNVAYLERAEIIREKGTNRTKFLRGEVDKYSWVDIGSSYLPSELNAAFLLAQLEMETVVTIKRRATWETYYNGLLSLEQEGYIELAKIPKECQHNGHLFFIKCKDIKERQALINHLKQQSIYSVFHYIPLHSAKAGITLGMFHGEDKYTTKESERLLRLPLSFQLDGAVEKVINNIRKFYKNHE